MNDLSPTRWPHEHTYHEPAYTILRVCGFFSGKDRRTELLKALGLTSHVPCYRWMWPRSVSGGQNGEVPRKYWPKLIDIAHECGYVLESRHFVAEEAPKLRRHHPATG